MPKLTFTRDGRVAVHSHGSPDGYLGDAGDESLLRHLRSSIVFEEGLTAATVMRSLRPWAREIGEMGWIDYEAWDKAISRAHLRDVSVVRPVDPDEPDVEAILLKARIHVMKGDSGPGVPTISPEWDLLGLYRADDPRTPTGDVYCSLSLAFLDEWANLPLRIDPLARVVDQRRRKAGELTEAIEVEPTLFDTLILGLFDNMSAYGDPDDVDEGRREVIRMVEQIKGEFGD